jgi:hypothetical protein
MTSEQRDFLRKQIDVRMRERLGEAELSRRGARLTKVPRRWSDEGATASEVATTIEFLRSGGLGASA